MIIMVLIDFISFHLTIIIIVINTIIVYTAIHCHKIQCNYNKGKSHTRSVRLGVPIREDTCPGPSAL